jgi:hypothetical protein
LGFGEAELFELEKLAGAQAIQQHEGEEGEIAKGAKAFSETGDLVGRERDDHAPGLPQSQTGSELRLWPAIAKRGSCRIGVLEVGLASRDLSSVTEAIQTAQYAQTVIDGRGRGLGFTIELAADIVEQARFY